MTSQNGKFASKTSEASWGKLRNYKKPGFNLKGGGGAAQGEAIHKRFPGRWQLAGPSKLNQVFIFSRTIDIKIDWNFEIYFISVVSKNMATHLKAASLRFNILWIHFSLTILFEYKFIDWKLCIMPFYSSPSHSHRNWFSHENTKKFLLYFVDARQFTRHTSLFWKGWILVQHSCNLHDLQHLLIHISFSIIFPVPHSLSLFSFQSKYRYLLICNCTFKFYFYK